MYNGRYINAKEMFYLVIHSIWRLYIEKYGAININFIIETINNNGEYLSKQLSWYVKMKKEDQKQNKSVKEETSYLRKV